jgi:serine protease
VTPSTGSTTPVKVEVTPNDPLWDLQWDMKPRGSGEGQSLGGAGFQDFWTRQGIEGSSNVVVAVVDTGLQMTHPDIAASANIAPGWDMVSDPRMGNDGDGRDSDPNDPGDLCNPAVPGAADSFHGTHVAGTIGAAASNNGAGVAGGAWNVKIVPVRALGKCGGRLSDINDAIRWAAGLIPAEGEDGSEVWNDNPADIINLSIGLFEYCPASLQDAIDSVTERGAVVVSAAGNARIDTAYYAPGGCDNVISVAAGNALGEITAYSNFGDGVDILAPGGEMARDDDNDSRPDGILSTKASTDCYDPVTGEAVSDCYYAYEQGTSMAAPHVSAALALLKARDPEASSDELIETLMAATDPRTDMQCAGLCSDYPGTTPIPGSENMCRRPCGGRILNLANVPEPGGTTGVGD